MRKGYLVKAMSVMILAGCVAFVNPGVDMAASVNTLTQSIKGDSVDDDDDSSSVSDSDDSTTSTDDGDSTTSDETEINTDVLFFGEDEEAGISIDVDDTAELSYGYDTDVIDADNISFVSDDDSIVEVIDWNEETCNVEAYEEGECTISLLYNDEIIDTCDVTVESSDSDDSDSSSGTTYAKKLSVKSKLTIKKGKTKTLKVTVTPKNAKTKKKVTFSSSNKKVATVTAKGKIKAIAKGKTVITVKSSGLKSVKCKVTVK